MFTLLGIVYTLNKSSGGVAIQAEGFSYVNQVFTCVVFVYLTILAMMKQDCDLCCDYCIIGEQYLLLEQVSQSSHDNNGSFYTGCFFYWNFMFRIASTSANKGSTHRYQ